MAYKQKLPVKAYTQKIPPLASLCPWVLMAEDGVILEKGGSLLCAYEFIAPDLGSSSASRINSVSAMFNNAIVQLGDGWTVQFELQRRLSNEYPYSEFPTLTSYMVDRQREINFSYYGDHFENRYFLIFTYELPSEAEVKGVASFYKSGDRRKDSDLVRNQIRNFKAQTAKAMAIVQSAMRIERLNTDRLFTLLHSSVSEDWGKRILPKGSEIFLDRIVTDSDLETSMPMKLGDSYIPIVAVKAFPSETYPAIFDALNKAKCELRWSTRFTCFSKEQAKRRIEKAENKFHSSRKSIGQYVMESTMHVESTKENSAALAEESDANDAKIELYMGNIGYGDYTSSILVMDENLEAAEEKAKYVSGIITACGFSAVTETHNAFQAFLSMMPGNIWANTRSLFCSTGNLSHVVPTSSIWAGMKENNFMKRICGNKAPHIVCSTDYGIPHWLNLNVGDLGHAWISGPSGAGKSTLLSLLEIQWLRYPDARVIIFDKDRSARNVTMCNGGIYIEPGLDRTTFKPLVEIDDDRGISFAADFIEMLLVEQHLTVTPGMRKSIHSALKDMQTMPPETRSLSSFTGYCAYEDPVRHTNDINEALSPYLITGQFGNLFDADTDGNFAISGRWTMIEMGSLMERSDAVVGPALFYMFHECEKLFDGKPVLLVLDEAWLFLRNEVFARNLQKWLKVLRKYNVFVVFATQEIEDAINSPIGATIASACASKIYLANVDADSGMLKDAYRKFGLEPSEIKLLTRMLAKRDYFYKSSMGTRLFQLDLDELQLGILTCSVKDHKMLDALEKKYGRNSGKELVTQILDAKGIDYSHLVEKKKTQKEAV